MNNIFNIYYKKQDGKINYFLADEKGIIKNFEKCNTNNKIMLSDIKHLLKIGPSLRDLDIKFYDKSFDFFCGSNEKKQYYVCLKHIGSYESIKDTYDKLLANIKFNNKEICGLPMEQYINGRWNRESESDYLTVVMIPIKV